MVFENRTFSPFENTNDDDWNKIIEATLSEFLPKKNISIRKSN